MLLYKTGTRDYATSRSLGVGLSGSTIREGREVMYQLPMLAGINGLFHGFSTKKEEGNQRYGLEGPVESVTKNRAVFLGQICPPSAGAFFKIAVEMNSLTTGFEEEIRTVRFNADAGKGMIGTPGIPCEAMVTDSQGLFLYLTVGDCLPVIIFDPRRRVLALIHGGRESTIRKLPEKTLAVMRKQFRTDPADVIVGMGPGFRSHSLERLPASIGNDALWNIHISPNGHGTFRMNLFGYNRDRLMSAGVPDENIDECPYDTYTCTDYFSHRRSAETGEKEGRHACAVGMVG